LGGAVMSGADHGALAFAGRRGQQHAAANGTGRHLPGATHRLMPDGRIALILPDGPVLSDQDARRLAWGLLADLAPDDVIPTPEVVTYLEAQRLAVLRAVAAGNDTNDALMTALGWGVRSVQRRVRELIDDGRLAADDFGAGKIARFILPIEDKR